MDRNKIYEDKRHNPFAVKGLGKLVFNAIQFTWGLSVNMVGGIGYLILKKRCRHERFCNAYITYVPANFGGVSIGKFIFMAEGRKKEWEYNTRIHEYGHTIQCLFLGPLYWIAVAIPSSFWCNVLRGYRERNKISYYKLYCESWANRAGQLWSGYRQSGNK